MHLYHLTLSRPSGIQVRRCCHPGSTHRVATLPADTPAPSTHSAVRLCNATSEHLHSCFMLHPYSSSNDTGTHTHPQQPHPYVPRLSFFAVCHLWQLQCPQGAGGCCVTRPHTGTHPASRQRQAAGATHRQQTMAGRQTDCRQKDRQQASWQAGWQQPCWWQDPAGPCLQPIMSKCQAALQQSRGAREQVQQRCRGRQWFEEWSGALSAGSLSTAAAGGVSPALHSLMAPAQACFQ